MQHGNGSETSGYGFELAAVISITEVFGYGRDLLVSGCWFHLKQSLKRKRQNLHLDEAYNKDKQFKHLCLLIDGLAFLPEHLMNEGKFYKCI